MGIRFVERIVAQSSILVTPYIFQALFSRNRLYINGQKLRFKDSINDHVNVGEKLFFDMVRADPEEVCNTKRQWKIVNTCSSGQWRIQVDGCVDLERAKARY